MSEIQHNIINVPVYYALLRYCCNFQLIAFHSYLSLNQMFKCIILLAPSTNLIPKKITFWVENSAINTHNTWTLTLCCSYLHTKSTQFWFHLFSADAKNPSKSYKYQISLLKFLNFMLQLIQFEICSVTLCVYEKAINSYFILLETLNIFQYLQFNNTFYINIQ